MARTRISIAIGAVTFFMLILSTCTRAQGNREITGLRPAAVAKIVDELTSDISSESEAFDSLSTRLSDSMQHLGVSPRAASLADTIVAHGKILKAHIQGRMIYFDTVIAQLKARAGYQPAEERTLALRFFELDKTLLTSSVVLIDVVIETNGILHRLYAAPSQEEAKKLVAQIDRLNAKIDQTSKKQNKQAAELEKIFTKLLSYLKQ